MADVQMISSKRICIIPARGGSKRIPRKNIRQFAGKPIIAHSISAALASNCFDEVMVSTDDEEIAGIAREHGAHVPFLRSALTSGDFAGTLDVVVEVLERYRAENQQEFQLGCLLYATAPLVTPELLNQGLVAIEDDQGLDYVLSVVPFGSPVQRAVYIENNRLHMFHPEHYNTLSQDLKLSYKDAGQFFWFRTNQINEKVPVLGPSAGGVILSELEAQDIDNEGDWQMAELKYNLRRRRERMS